MDRIFNPCLCRNLKGIEYELERGNVQSPLENENCWVIKKQFRSSPTEVQVLALYYVVGTGPACGTVFQMPSLHRVARCNLTSATYFLQKAFDEIQSHIKFNPVTHYSWDFEDERRKIQGDTQQAESKEQTALAENQRHRYSHVVDDVLRRMMAHGEDLKLE